MRRAVTAGALAVLTALTTAACAGQAPGGTVTPPAPTEATTAPPTTEPATPDDEASGPTLPEAVETTFPGAPDGVETEDVTVVAGSDDRHVDVVTVGSSTCPVVPTDVAWDGDAQVLRITLSDPDAYTGMCTMDLVPTTSVVTLPDDVPGASGLSVEVAGRTVALP